ncbi:MAG TPA: GNAT family N-acetyltransferase [Gemmatimonadales bacterium]|nr:GNAT family N-acetyltransferase [Gemmatimonadales bacterium]
MSASLQLDAVESGTLTARVREAIRALCEEAYQEELASYFTDVGPGLHLLGRVDGALVTHAMLVPRVLETAATGQMRTAYVELVATRPSHQRRGYASHLLEALIPFMRDFTIGALSPSDAAFYDRLGWERWRGPLSVRTPSGDVPTPDEEVMILRLPRTPSALDVDAALSIEWRPGEVW